MSPKLRQNIFVKSNQVNRQKFRYIVYRVSNTWIITPTHLNHSNSKTTLRFNTSHTQYFVIKEVRCYIFIILLSSFVISQPVFRSSLICVLRFSINFWLEKKSNLRYEHHSPHNHGQPTTGRRFLSCPIKKYCHRGN